MHLTKAQPRIPDPGEEELCSGAQAGVQAVAAVLYSSLGPSTSGEGIVQDPWFVATVARSYRLQFQRRPPTFSGVKVTSVQDPVLMSVLVKEVQELLLKGVISEVPPSAQLTGFYSKYFIVPKKDGGHRPVLDLRPLN